jgi:hypothetical protein
MPPCPSVTVVCNEANPGASWRDRLRPVLSRWTARRPSIHLVLAVFPALLALLAVSGCSMPQQRFSHSRHRENFAMTREELKGLQFYLSGEVLVKVRPAADAAAGDDPKGREPEPVEQAVLFPAGTPGVVTAVGPDWLRVSFLEGRTGVYFLANAKDKYDDLYYLATKDEKGDLRRVEDLEPRTITYELRTYTVVYGAGAHLTVDGEALQELIEGRTRSEGRKVE